MKKHILDFIRRGGAACGLGPLVLAILYVVLEQNGTLEILTVRQVCVGIFSLSALAFIAGGMNVIYQIEQLPLLVAISIHGAVLYLSYLATYLMNGWLKWGSAPVLVFTGIFVVGFIGIWVVICSIIRKNTNKVNQMLNKKRQNDESGMS